MTSMLLPGREGGHKGPLPRRTVVVFKFSLGRRAIRDSTAGSNREDAASIQKSSSAGSETKITQGPRATIRVRRMSVVLPKSHWRATKNVHANDEKRACTNSNQSEPHRCPKAACLRFQIEGIRADRATTEITLCENSSSHRPLLVICVKSREREEMHPWLTHDALSMRLPP